MQLRVLVLQTRKQIMSELQAIGVDPVGVGILLDKAELLLLKIKNVRVPAAKILKKIMLSNVGDAGVCRGAVDFSVDTTDIVLMGTRKQYKRLFNALKLQPFGLKLLSKDIELAIESFSKERNIFRCGRFELPIGERAYIMGILNVTPDSFSDGGKFIHVTRQ